MLKAFTNNMYMYLNNDFTGMIELKNVENIKSEHEGYQQFMLFKKTFSLGFFFFI